MNGFAFRWAKCDEGRNDDGELGFLKRIGLECDVFCMRRSFKGGCEAFRSAKSFFLGLLGGGERWDWGKKNGYARLEKNTRD
ncbi:hypothetical protein [Planomicrobium sp. MB-3u-38]|uniref:hypothetical protein n=1 Tax=Planomicrobium sp. MB-3u-38 TaxID=2058318 RepID=UPI000C7DA862|nr:hypothetical protein [Planomicrobium sp. MB-3u-38]PKH10743.1 hypothetical protein CXF70_08395 [Planomicrobium sp. MB-3u-38]